MSGEKVQLLTVLGPHLPDASAVLHCGGRGEQGEGAASGSAAGQWCWLGLVSVKGYGC